MPAPPTCLRPRAPLIGPALPWLCCLAAAAAAEPACTVAYRGSVMLPAEVADPAGRPVALVGMSGIAWLGTDRYAAVMDNSDAVVLFSLELAPDGAPRAASRFEVLRLAERHDHEDLAPCAGGRAPAIHVCEEDTPAIRTYALGSGAIVGGVPVPAVLRGRRPNRGLEALAVEADGEHLWTANEEAVVADGPAAGEGRGTVVRLVRLPLGDGGQRPFQAAYAVDPPHTFARLIPGEPLAGVVALVALGEGRLLVLERSAAPGLPPFTSRIHLVDTAAAVDVSGIASGLAARPELHVAKTLLWSGALGLNLEGLCLGPPGTLVGIADNGGLGTPTAIVGFAFTDGCTP